MDGRLLSFDTKSFGFGTGIDEGLNDILEKGGLLGFVATKYDEGLSEGLRESRVDGRLLGFVMRLLGFPEGYERTFDGIKLGGKCRIGDADGVVVALTFLLDGFCDCFGFVVGLNDIRMTGVTIGDADGVTVFRRFLLEGF